MPLFTSASGFQINGGTFLDFPGGVNLLELHCLRILHQAAVSDAFHDSAERYPQPECHPQTRTWMLMDLWHWSSKTDSQNGVLWLHGPAGAGKSAIAQSFCQELGSDNRLGASFFFKRGHPSRGSGNRLFPTIAYQLALCLPELKLAITRVVEDNPSIIDRTLSTQLQKLIIEPCRRSIFGGTLVIVVDGLDECEGQNIQQEILRSIGSAVHNGALPLRFFVASRPEGHIQDVFRGPLKKMHRPLNINPSFEGVRKYLLDEFARIHRQHDETMATVPCPWPKRNVVEALVQNSSGYFIYASTVIKYVDDKSFRPTDRLEVILGIAEADSGSPFGPLDQLYTQILSEAPARPQFLRILTVVASDLGFSRVAEVEQLLNLKSGDVRLALRGLQSVIHITVDRSQSHPHPGRPSCPAGTRSRSRPGGSGADSCNLSDSSDDHSYNRRITPHHASFFDFLRDPTRAGIFCVNAPSQRTDLACRILKEFVYMYQSGWLNGPSLNRHNVIWWVI
ncbi:hypothetical protein B0H13DRAFT_1619851 [Mycena leptocephala]|nr:hypothetical protein B0H13DRAFT_1619851 [Mycena leptocephala]